MAEIEALEILKDAGLTIEGKRIRMPNGMYPKRVWRAFDYLVFECNYGSTLLVPDAEPMVG